MQESEAWSKQNAPSARRGLSLLLALQHRLSAAEQKLRDDAFSKAEQFVGAAQRAGGADAPIAKSFTVAGDRENRRVDLEVIVGKAFHP